MTTTLLLSDILARGTAIEWFEAVALVSEVADRVRDSIGGRGVPELDQVQLSADGTVSIAGAVRTQEPVRRLGQLLQACLVQSEPPVQLRLVAAQATAPEPGYASISDCAHALAYFERPDRPQALRNLYDRAQATPVRSMEVSPTLDAIAPLRTPMPERQVASARAQRPRRATLLMAAVLVLIVAATAYSQLIPGAPAREDVTTIAVKASDAVGTTLVKGISAVSETVGLGRLVPASEAGATPPVKPPAPVAVQPPRSRAASARTTAPPRLRVFDLPIVPVVTGISSTLSTGAVTVTTPDVAPPVDVERTDEAIYSEADSNVVAPVGLRPQLPRALPEDIRADQLSQIELIVLPDGTVGSVKLLGRGRSVLEGMLLSAAKAWKFTPAKKDGRPVAYRKTVWLVLE